MPHFGGAYKTQLIIIIINSNLKLKFQIISAKPIFFLKEWAISKERKLKQAKIISYSKDKGYEY